MVLDYLDSSALYEIRSFYFYVFQAQSVPKQSCPATCIFYFQTTQKKLNFMLKINIKNSLWI
jgi:hypothetical protein